MDNLEFYKPILTKFLSDWESELQGSNYSVVLGFKVKAIESSLFSPLDTLSKMYPEGNLDHAVFEEMKSTVVVSNIIEKILDKDPKYGYPAHYTKELVQKISSQYKLKLESLIRNFITINNSKAFNCNDLPTAQYEVFWGFSYLLIDSKRNNAFYLYGGASD